MTVMILCRRSILCIIVLLSICWVPAPLFAQFNNTGNFYIATGGSVYVNAAVTNAATSSYRNDGNLYVTGDFTNNQPGMAAGLGTTSFIGTATQNVNGVPSFYKLLLSNTVDFGTSSTTVADTLSNTAGIMTPGTSTIIFTGNAGAMTGTADKNFYTLQVINGALISHVAGSGAIHVFNQFTNDGKFVQPGINKTFFDAAGVVETFTGSTGSSTQFGNFIIGSASPGAAATVLNTGASNFTIAGNNMQFNSSGSLLNSSTGAVTFGLTTAGSSSILNSFGVSGTAASFYDVNIDSASSISPIATGLNFGGSGLSIINHNLTINQGGTVINNAPYYGNTSTLIYNTTSPVFTVSNEWTGNATTSGIGIPQNVTIQNSNNVTLPNADRGMAGNLNINAGTLSMNVSSGNLYVGGNWSRINTASFVPNNRTIFFNGSGAQAMAVTAGGTEIFDFLVNSNTLADVTMNSNVTLNQKIKLQTGSVFAINGNTLTLQSTIDNSAGNAGSFRGSATSNLNLAGTGQVGSLQFTPGGQTLNTFAINRSGITNNYAVVLGSDLTVNTLTLTNGIIATGAHMLTSNSSGLSIVNNSSFVATCDATGNPLIPNAGVYTGNVGFMIKNVSGNTDFYFPVGASFLNSGSNYSATPNRMMVNMNNQGSADISVFVGKEGMPYTASAVVNRIWYVNATNVSGSIKATLKCFFTNRNWSTNIFPVQEDEVESGFDASTNVALVQDDYGSNNYFINRSGGSDIQSFGVGNYGNELFGLYTYGISADAGGNTNGINQFNKFAVVNSPGIILPVTITNLRASLQNSAVQLTWTSLDETNIDHYEIERSTNAISFNGIGSKTALNNGSLQTAYGFTDLTPASGKNYYRIKVVEKDGHSSYTNVVLIETVNGKIAVTVAPNPVINKKVMVTLVNAPAGKYNCILFAANGQKIWERSLLHEGGSSQYSIRLSASLAQGVYFMHVENTDIQVVTKLLIQ